MLNTMFQLRPFELSGEQRSAHCARTANGISPRSALPLSVECSFGSTPLLRRVGLLQPTPALLHVAENQRDQIHEVFRQGTKFGLHRAGSGHDEASQVFAPQSTKNLDHLYLDEINRKTTAKMIAAAWHTSMRQDELGGMERRQLRLKERIIDLWETKTRRLRTAPLDEKAAGTLSGTLAHLHSRRVSWHGEGDRYRNLASRFAALRKRAAERGLIE